MKIALGYIAFCVVVLSLEACQHSPRSEKTASKERLSSERFPQSESDVEVWVSRISALANSANLNSATCSAQIEPMLEDLERVNPAILKMQGTALDKQREASSRWLQTLFEARLKMRSRVSELVKKGTVDPCLRSVKRFLVYLRFAEEMITEAMVNFNMVPPQDEDNQESAFRGPFPATLVNPKFGKLEFKSGDVLLDRGDSALSAQIARIGDVEHLFSHAMIVGEDAKGNLYVVETTAKDIVGVETLQDYWDANADARMAVFRHPDQHLARAAGKFIYQYVMKNRGNILYDFHMNEKDSSEMFCSEVVQFAYRKASQGQMVPPLFRTNVSQFKVMGDANWVKRMGVPYENIFAPNDIDVDDRFEQVAEYRYVPDLRARRLDDAVMSSLYSWMLNKHYVFVSDIGDVVLSNVGKLKAHLFGDDEIAPNMPKGVIVAALEFDRAFGIIRENLGQKDDAYFSENGVSMPFQMMLRINEQFRANDCQQYKNQFMDRSFDGSGGSETFLHMVIESKKACP